MSGKILQNQLQNESTESPKHKNEIEKKLIEKPILETKLEPVKPEMTAIANNEEESHNIDDYPLEPDSEQYSTIKRSPHSKSNSLQSPDETSSSNNTDTALYQDDEEVMRTKVSVTVQQSQSQTVAENNKNGYLGERSECK